MGDLGILMANKRRAGLVAATVFFTVLSGMTAAQAETLPDDQPEFTLDSISTQLTGRSQSENNPFVVVWGKNGNAVLIDTSLSKSENPGMSGLTSASKKFIDLSWGALKDPSSYEIYRDGVKIAETRKTSFRDRKVAPGNKYEYRVSASGLKDRSDWTEQEVQAVQAGQPAPRVSFMWSFEATALQEDSIQSAEAQSASLTTAFEKLSASEIRWASFIPERRLGAPGWPCEYGAGYEFEGDDRSWYTPDYQWEHNNYVSSRIRHKSTIYWWGSTPSLSSEIYLGDTRVYQAGTDNLVAQRLAVPENDTRVMSTPSSTSIDIRAAFSAGNPFCSMNSISVVYRASVTSTGNYAMSASYRRMPAHEAYIYNYWGDPLGNNGPVASKVTAILRDDVRDPFCLAGWGCQEATFSGGGTFESNL